MTRYSSIEEVNAVLVELEEYEPVSTDKANSEKHSDTEKPRSRSTSGSISVNGQIHANGIEENGRVHEAMADSESDSESCTIDPEGHDEEEDLDEGNHDDVCDSEDDYEERDGLATDEDEEVHVRQRVIEVDPQEEAKYEKELRALMQ